MVHIIVPVYKCEKSIIGMLENLRQQDSFENVNFIFVDDFSVDNTYEVLSRETKPYKNCVVLKNKYAKSIGGARNVGIAYLSNMPDSDIIGFCDSDDAPYLSRLLDLAGCMERNDADIGIGEYDLVRSVNGVVLRAGEGAHLDRTYLNRPLLKSEIKLESLFSSFDTSVCNKLFRNDLLKKYRINFPVCSYREGLSFVYSALSVADKLYVTSDVVYQFTESTERVSMRDLFLSLNHVWEFIRSTYCDDIGIKNALSASFTDEALRYIQHAYHVSGKHESEIRKEVRRYGYYGFVKEIWCTM